MFVFVFVLVFFFFSFFSGWGGGGVVVGIFMGIKSETYGNYKIQHQKPSIVMMNLIIKVGYLILKTFQGDNDLVYT